MIILNFVRGEKNSIQIAFSEITALHVTQGTHKQHKAGSLQLCLRKTCQGCFLIAELKDKNTLRGKVFGTRLFLLLFISQCCYDPKIKQSHKQRFLPACV